MFTAYFFISGWILAKAFGKGASRAMATGKLLTVPKERERGREAHFTFLCHCYQLNYTFCKLCSRGSCLLAEKRTRPPPCSKGHYPPSPERKDRGFVDRCIKEDKESPPEGIGHWTTAMNSQSREHRLTNCISCRLRIFSV